MIVEWDYRSDNS